MPPLLHRQAEAGGQRRPHREVRASLRPARQEVLTALEPDRRARLVAVKLATLAREQLGVDAEPTTFPGGAALVGPDGRAVVLVDEAPAQGLGRALAWARQAKATSVDLLVDADAGHLARRAAAFADPPTVWWIQGRELHRAEPEPLPTPPPVPPGALDLAPALVAAGADVVVEHGVVTGEVLGLEIARIVGDERGGDLRIEAGVGRHDREAFAMVHGDLPEADALATVVGTARAARMGAAEDHPLRRLAQERWLREVLVARPDLVGLAELERHEGPLPRPSVKDPWPAVAVGDGGRTVVVCSVGIDLDLVPFAADARLAATGGHDARLLLAVPERDDHPVTRALAAALANPAEVVPVPGDWRAATGS